MNQSTDDHTTPRMKRGDKVLITYRGQIKVGLLLLASENAGALMLGFDGTFRDGKGGIFVGMMAVLKDDDGAYVDLIAGQPVEIEPARSEP
jgi:hypothetical protein